MLCLSLGIIFLWSDDITDKQRQLEKLQKEIKEAETRAAKAESQKKQKESEIASTRKAKSKTDADLRKAQTEANEKLSSLNLVKRELRTVSEQIQDLHSMQNEQLICLMKSRNRNQTLRFVPVEQHLLVSLATQSRERLNGLGDVQQTLSAEEVLKDREFAEVDKKVKSTYRTSRTLDTKVRSLETETSKLSREQKQLADRIAKLRKDAAQLESLIAQLTSQSDTESPSYRFSSRTIAWPLRGKIIRRFGEETRSYGTSVVCNGIDIEVDEWTPVVAADAGEVVFAATYGGQGKLVIIDHKNGFFTVYAYNNELMVSPGSYVKKGQTIAKSGMTGSASVPSLHFEVRKDGKAVNPLLYLE